MGILNVTPDSFSDGAEHATREAAIAHGRLMLAQGADLIDVGGESSRPGARPVSLDEELARVVPVIRELAPDPRAVIAIDTTKPEVARAAVAAGATLVNDIGGLRDARMRDALAELQVPVVAMHMQGTPETMQRAPRYDDVVAEILAALGGMIELARSAGLSQVVLDPGIGFGKTLEHNLELLRSLGQLRRLGAPLLVGTSRKGFLGQILGTSVTERLEGSLATLALAAAQGVDVVRVHDVQASVRCLAVADAIVRGGPHG